MALGAWVDSSFARLSGLRCCWLLISAMVLRFIIRLVVLMLLVVRRLWGLWRARRRSKIGWGIGWMDINGLLRRLHMGFAWLLVWFRHIPKLLWCIVWHITNKCDLYNGLSRNGMISCSALVGVSASLPSLSILHCVSTSRYAIKCALSLRSSREPR